MLGTKNNDLGVERWSSSLEGKKIALGVGGGIAAIEAPKIARQLRRYGASVQVYASKQALRFVGETALQWGSAQPKVVSDFEGNASHVIQEDFLLLAPMTATLASKIAHGIADDPISALALSALGFGKPVVVAPSMHQSLAANPFHKEAMQRLTKVGLKTIPPLLREGKLKLSSSEVVAAWASHHLARHVARGRTWLITGGGVPSPIDAVRSMNNNATGNTAVELAKNLFIHGGHPLLLLPSEAHCDWEECLKPIRFGDVIDYEAKIMSLIKDQKIDLAVFSAAVSDYGLEGKTSQSKLRSEVLELRFRRHRKVVERAKQSFPNLPMVVFKYEPNLTKQQLLAKGRDYTKKGYDGVLLNPVPKPNPKRLRGFFLDQTGEVKDVADGASMFFTFAQGLEAKPT